MWGNDFENTPRSRTNPFVWRKGNRQSIKQKNSQRCEFFLHYFEGAGRIVSKLGNGTFAQPLGITAGGVNYTKLTAEQQKALDTYVRSLGVPPGPPTQQGIYATPEFTGDPYPTAVIKPVEENQEPPEGWPRNPIFNALGDVPGPPVQFGPPVEPATVKPGEGFTGIGLPENDIFYFHPDHLGSTSYITSRNGSISQHVEYIAFGEVLFEEHSSSFSSPYLFNGKELDRETNLSYNGARYLDMKTSLWLSVDPLAEKFFNQSPYNYALNNPIRYIDPTGMSSEDGIDPPKKYGGGIQVYQAAEANGSVPGGYSRASESFNVGDYSVLPNYITNSKGKEELSHYTASVNVNVVNSSGVKEEARVDYVFGKNDLKSFKDNVKSFESAANLMFGGGTKLSDWQINKLNGNNWIGGFLFDQWTDPVNLLAGATALFGGSSINSIDDVMSNPNLLRGKTPSRVEAVLRNTENWKVETLGRGSQKGNGWVLRQYNSKGNPSGPQIRWHPGGGHHGPKPYWRVIGNDGDIGGIIR